MSEGSTAPPRRARLELLVRPEEGDGFEVRQIGSGVAFIQSRPARVSAGSFELAEVASKVDGQRSFILKNTATDRFLLLSEHEKFLWEQMNGRRRCKTSRRRTCCATASSTSRSSRT